RGKPLGALEQVGPSKKRGTAITFLPDEEIFKEHSVFQPARLVRLARSKAYLFRGVEIRWNCAKERIHGATPEQAVFHFPNGLADYLAERTSGIETVTPESFSGRVERPNKGDGGDGAVAWA